MKRLLCITGKTFCEYLTVSPNPTLLISINECVHSLVSLQIIYRESGESNLFIEVI